MKNKDNLRQAIRQRNLTDIKQATTSVKFSFFSKKGPFTSFDFLLDGPPSDDDFKQPLKDK